MEPVNSSHLNALVKKRPILLINTTCLAFSYVDGLVRRSVAAVTTKQGKRLPLELWRLILEQNDCSGRQLSRQHQYDLIQPLYVRSDGDNGQSLHCLVIQDRKLCGGLDDAWSIEVYNGYLRDPISHSCDAYSPCPCHISDKYAPLVLPIPTAVLDSSISALYKDVTVPDVISWAETGRCDLCDERRSLCPGCGSGPYARENFISWRIPSRCGVTMFCPLCIGLWWAEESLAQIGEEYGELFLERMDGEDYSKWYRGRLRALGY